MVPSDPSGTHFTSAKPSQPAGAWWHISTGGTLVSLPPSPIALGDAKTETSTQREGDQTAQISGDSP